MEEKKLQDLILLNLEIVDSIETVRFEVKENIIEIKSSKLDYILNEMVKTEYK